VKVSKRRMKAPRTEDEIVGEEAEGM